MILFHPLSAFISQRCQTTATLIINQLGNSLIVRAEIESDKNDRFRTLFDESVQPRRANGQVGQSGQRAFNAARMHCVLGSSFRLGHLSSPRVLCHLGLEFRGLVGAC